MRKVSSYKCPECGMSYKTLSGWGEHVRRMHPDIIPKGWSDARFFYYTLTGRTEGRCIQCHRPTEWNEATGKYSRYCNDPKCKQEYCKVAKQRMIDKYGKPHLLDDPEKQREMLKGKKISGEYKFSDGGKLPYVGSYERDFLMTCDVVLGLTSKDIIAPSPHNYVYMYEDKPHFYIPDFYIPDFNLEIEVKDGGDNPNKHHKIQEVDKVKEKLKDQVMIGNPAVNYFKVVDKKYDDFFDFILKCKNAIDDDKLQQVQAKISSNRTPAMEGIRLPPLFEARKNAMIEADKFAAEFDSVAGPMFEREIEIAFAKYRDYSNLTHQYSYPYRYTRRSGKFIDSTYKNNENIIIEIPLMVVDTKTPRRFDDDSSFDDKRIIDILKNFERNIMSTIKLRNVYKRFPNVSAPYVQWDGYDWMLKVTFNYSVEPANESANCDEDIANESAFISYKDEYFNLDEWKREIGHNILYIAGLSGSGKSTLGRDISKKYNATYIELDRIASDWWYEDEKFNPNGYQGNVTALLKEIFKDEDPREEFKTAIDRSVMRKRRYSKLYEYCLKHPDQLFVFEGVQIAGYFDIDFLVDKPVIIKNTSRNTSFKRMSIRDRETWNNHEDYLNMKANYKADDHNLDSLRKLMRSKASKSKSLPATEATSADSTMDKILEFNKRMNKFKYGLAVNGMIDASHNTSGSDFDKLYHFANPAQFEKQNGGICWDFVTYEADYFKKNIPEIKFTCWYVIFNAAPNYPTHTFLTFKLGLKYILFESSFRKIKGVWEASSEKDLINFELDSMIHHDSDKGLDKAESHVFKYNALDTSLNGMTCGEFMHHIEEVGRYVNHSRSTNFKVEKYTPDEAANESVGSDSNVVYHVSFDKLDNLTLRPRVPQNFFTSHGYEDSTTKRVSLCPSVDKCLMAMSQNLAGKTLYVYSVDISHIKHVTPSTTQVPDSAVTSEIWALEPVTLAYVGSIEVGKSYGSGESFTYGNQSATLYQFSYKWKDKVANESVGSDASYYGLPEDKKYPMDDPKHVLLAIKFFNYVDEDKERLLASRINERIKEFGIHNINVGEKNRFAKYYEAVEEEVLVNWAPNVPYMTVANEGSDPSVQLLDDGFAYAPIKFDNDLYEKYNGTDYYPLYIILMKNISPLGSTIRAFTKEEYSHAAISFDATMDDVYTFGNSVIKKPFGKQKSFGAAHESFRKNTFKFSYSEKTEYSLYVMFFKKDEIDRIKKKVDEIFLHHEEYKYNIEGLISYVFNKPKTDPKKLFCSQFVALVINSGRNGILNKDPSMYTPVGLSTIRGVCHIETGRICDYDQYRVEKKTHALFDSLIENKAYEALEHANIMYNA